MHFPNALVFLLYSLALGIAAHPFAPTSEISSQPVVQARSEAGPHEAMIYARAGAKSGKSSSSGGTDGNSTDTTTSSASGPVIVGGYAPLALGMGIVAALGLTVL